MKGVSILRRLVSTRPSIITRSSSSPLVETLTLSSAAATASYFTLILSDELRKPQFHFDIATKTSAHLSGLPINYRNFSSDSASGQSKMVSIETEKQLNDSLMKAEASHDSVPSIFYFTAAWCGPCKFLSPIIGQLSEKYPHVTTYKVDIDKVKELIWQVFGKIRHFEISSEACSPSCLNPWWRLSSTTQIFTYMILLPPTFYLS